MKIKFEHRLDLGLVRDKLEEAADDAYGNLGEVTVDESEYEVTEYEVTIDQTDDGGEFVATVAVTLERVTGKFASKEDVAEAVAGEITLDLDLSSHVTDAEMA